VCIPCPTGPGQAMTFRTNFRYVLNAATGPDVTWDAKLADERPLGHRGLC
jgi:hypothetical protein